MRSEQLAVMSRVIRCVFSSSNFVCPSCYSRFYRKSHRSVLSSFLLSMLVDAGQNYSVSNHSKGGSPYSSLTNEELRCESYVYGHPLFR